MSRQVKRAWAILKKAEAKSHEQGTIPPTHDWYHPTKQHIKELSETIVNLEAAKAQNLTPEELTAQLKLGLDEYQKFWNARIEEQKQRRQEAEKQWAFQATPFYRICLGATYEIFSSEAGRKIAQEIKTFDTPTLKDAIKRLRNHELTGYPLSIYDSSYIQRVIDYLVAEIQTRT